MQFFPYNIPVTKIAVAVSASSTPTASYLANFAAVPVNTVNTASLALNIVGTNGANGAGIVVPGPKGPTGDRGLTGFRGDSIYLLSSSWYSGATCSPPPSTCNQIIFGAGVFLNGQWFCDYGQLLVYYTTAETFVEGSPLFSNDICTSGVGTVGNVGAYSTTSTVYSTTNNVTAILAICNTSI